MKLKLIIVVTTTLFLSFPMVAFGQSNYSESDHGEIESLLGDLVTEYGIHDALADAGRNWKELWKGIKYTDKEWRADACWLIQNMPHLDRLEMTAEILEEHVRYAYVAKTELPYSIPDELFREYLLTYRIGDEPVRSWRKEIWYLYPWMIKDTPLETARTINQWVSENFTLRERGFFGPRPDPISTIKAKRGTFSDITAVTIACCKTFGVPARLASVSVLGGESGGLSFLEIYSDGKWIPMYPMEPEFLGDFSFLEKEFSNNVTLVKASTAFSEILVTEQYSDTGKLRLVFTRNGEPVDNFENFSLNVWNDGAWRPLDDIWLSASNDNPTEFSASVGDGSYLLIVGVRNERGDAYIRSKIIVVRNGKTIELTIPADNPDAPIEEISESIDSLDQNHDQEN